MKLQELFLTQEDKTKLAMQKLKGLKHSIEDGDAPEIQNASGSMQGPAWADLKQLGYAEKETEPQGGMEMADRWVLLPSAPGPITLLKRVNGNIVKHVMQPGDKTDWAYYSVD